MARNAPIIFDVTSERRHWPEPSWRYQVLVVLVILLALAVMTLAAH